MPRILAIDFGLKRTGLAITDPLKIIASGLTTVHTSDLLQFLKKYCDEEAVECFVIGLPKQMDGTDSESEVYIQKFIKHLEKQHSEIPIKRVDERFTSKMAVNTMINSGLKKSKRKNKALIDEISATIILQTYLDRLS